MTRDVAIYSPQDDVRLLLRGLLRLHRYHIADEGTAPAALQALPKDVDAVVVVDADLDEVGWAESISTFHKARPALRIVLLCATRSPRVESQARAMGISAVVRRPFAVHQLVEAVNGPEAAEVAPPSAPGDPPTPSPPPVAPAP